MTEEQTTAIVDQQPSTDAPAPAAARPPSAEQAGQQQGQAPASKPTPPLDVAGLQAGFYKLSRTNAVMKKAVGLSATATDEELDAKIKALVAPEPQVSAEYDPEIAKRQQEMIEREWKTAERVAGPEKVALARQIQELALYNAASPLDFVDAVEALVGQFQGQQPQQPAPVPSNGAAQPQSQQGRVDDIAPEGDAPVGWQMKPEQDEIGSGDVVGAAQRMFARLGLG